MPSAKLIESRSSSEAGRNGRCSATNASASRTARGRRARFNPPTRLCEIARRHGRRVVFTTRRDERGRQEKPLVQASHPIALQIDGDVAVAEGLELDHDSRTRLWLERPGEFL